MVDKKDEKRGKAGLLRSGLPLEHVVAGMLGAKGFSVAGEYTYGRLNEEEVCRDFSVDLLAFRLMGQVRDNKTEMLYCLNLLVECKYSRRGIKWIFSPHEPDNRIKCGFININQDLCVKRVGTEALRSIEVELQHCIRGTALIDNKDADARRISNGLYQLRYASPHLTARKLDNQVNVMRRAEFGDDKYLLIEVICPILVTTAPLYVLKHGLGMEDFYDMETLKDVADEVDGLVMYQEEGAEMDDYCFDIWSKLVKKNSHMKWYISSLQELLEESGCAPHVCLDVYKLGRAMMHSSRNILVTNLDGLKKWVRKVERVLLEAGSSVYRYAALELDSDGESIVIGRCGERGGMV